MIIDIKRNVAVGSMPGGTVGQFSFRRLVEILQHDGELRAGETITHLDVQIRDGVIRYRVEKEPA